MIMAYLLLAMCVLIIRGLAGYDSRFRKGKYITIKSTVLSKILLDTMSPYTRNLRPKRDRNKMSVTGAYLYSALLAVLVINLVFLLIPDIPSESWVIDTDRFFLFTSTLNDKISAISILLLFLSIFVCIFPALAYSVKEASPVWVKILILILLALMLLIDVFTSTYLLIELVRTFL